MQSAARSAVLREGRADRYDQRTSAVERLSYSRSKNSATPRISEPSPINGLLGRFRPLWASYRGVGMAIFELGMLSRFAFSARRPK